MNNNVQKWLDALRSGEYKQGASALTRRTDEGDLDCCLGVACKLFMAEHPDQLSVEEGDNNDGILFYVDHTETDGFHEVGRYDGTLPPVVQHWLDIRSSIGSWSLGESLTSQNDDGDSFDLIAATIEEHPELFND